MHTSMCMYSCILWPVYVLCVKTSLPGGMNNPSSLLFRCGKPELPDMKKPLKIFQRADGPKSPEFSKFLGAIKKNGHR